MANFSRTLPAALCLAYPLSLATSYLASSIFLKIRNGRDVHASVDREIRRPSSVFWVICALCAIIVSFLMLTSSGHSYLESRGWNSIRSSVRYD